MENPKLKVCDWFPQVYGVDIKMEDYQRDYTWDIDNIDSLIEELKESETFLGGIAVKCDKSGNKLIVVDGQQRLTTILLIYKALSLIPELNVIFCYNLVDGWKRGSATYEMANEIQRMILDCILKDSSFNRNEISNEASIKCLKDYKKDRLIKAYKYIKNKIFGFSCEDLDNFFENLRLTSLTSLKIPDSCDEVEVFKNLNTKGKGLEISEIIKSYFPDEQCKKKFKVYCMK